MRTRGKVLLVLALAVFAVVFGVVGTVAPPLAEVKPSESSPSSSSSVAHFANPPTYDSGWMDIEDKCGRYFNVTHGLDTREVFVDIVGRQSMNEACGEHQRNLRGIDCVPRWSRTYAEGHAGARYASSIVQTSDDGYTIAGWQQEDNSSFPWERDGWLARVDVVGNLIWSKTYGWVGAYDYFSSVVQTSDGGYAVAGTHGPEWTFPWLGKIDSAGNLQWNRTYYAYRWPCLALVQTSEGGYLLAGSEFNDAIGRVGALLKTDVEGNEQWRRYYDYPNMGIEAVVSTKDGCFAMAGYIYNISEGMQAWVGKADSSGELLWNATYGVQESDEAFYSVAQTADGGYALAGGTGNGDEHRFYGDLEISDFLLVKTDAFGNMQWNKTYGWSGNEAVCSVIQTPDRGYSLAGYTNSTGFGGYDAWLVKTDEYGSVQWEETYGTAYDDYCYSMARTCDNGFSLAGESAGSAWLFKTDTESGIMWTDSTNDTITLYRGKTDAYWNYVRVRVWLFKEPSWIYGDINMDGVVDARDLYILSRNYGKTFSVLSLGGIAAVAGVHTYQKRKHQNS